MRAARVQKCVPGIFTRAYVTQAAIRAIQSPGAVTLPSDLT